MFVGFVIVANFAAMAFETDARAQKVSARPGSDAFDVFEVDITPSGAPCYCSCWYQVIDLDGAKS